MRELLVIALPMMASSACDVVMTFTDRLFLSKLGSAQMNAALGGGLMSFLLLTFFMGLIGYSTALVAQYLGAGKKGHCSTVVTQALGLALVAYPIILLLSPLVRRIFQASGIAPEQLGPQTIYFNILVLASPIGLLRAVFSGFFSGIGRTRIVMVASLGSMAVNVVAAYLLIFGKCGFPALGIEGAAYGTIVGGACGLALLVAAYFTGKAHREFEVGRSFRLDPAILKKLFKFGYPAGLEFSMNFAAFSAMILIFQSCGQVVATAATVTFNWDMVAFIPLIGIEIAVTSMVGRAMGAGRPDDAHRSTLSGLKVGMLYSGAMLAMFLAFPVALVNVFRPHVAGDVFEQALPLTLFMVRWVAAYVLVEAVVIAFSGALRGAGDTHWVMRASITLHWALVAMMVLMLKVWHASPQAAWVAMIAWFMLFSLVFLFRYRSGKWRKIKVIHPSEEEENTPLRDGFYETRDL